MSSSVRSTPKDAQGYTFSRILLTNPAASVAELVPKAADFAQPHAAMVRILVGVDWVLFLGHSASVRMPVPFCAADDTRLMSPNLLEFEE